MQPSLNSVLTLHFEDAAVPCPPMDSAELSTLAEVFDRLPDPRRVRGRRYRLGSLLGLRLVAVLGGARSLAQIARFAADAAPEAHEQLELARATPNASPLGRLLARLDADTVDDTVGAWPARRATDPVDEPDRLTGLAVDGKTVRGSRTDGHAVHLLAAALHDSQTAIAQRQVAAKSNEIPAFTPLLENLDLRGVVVTADAMHTQREHAHHIVAASGHYLLVVKGNQKKLCKQIKRLPWSEIPLQGRTTTTGHGRREIRQLKACTVAPGLRLPHAVQAMQIKRRRVNHQTGRIQTKTVYAVTSLTPEQADPARLAELVQDHWSVKALHHVRDVTYGEDASRIRTGTGPASWPPFATSPSA
jgi:predicted transposase YbfD/YdcC